MPSVIVTGAAGNLGSAVARRLSRDGYDLAITDIDEAGLGRTAEDVARTPLCIPADVQHFDEVEQVVTKCVEAWGRLDALVNVAGGPLGFINPIWELAPHEWEQVVRTNLTGSFHWVKAAAPTMIAQQEGHIVLVASGSGVRPGQNLSAYSASKAGVIGLMRAAALDLGQHRVKVNAVCPGLIPNERKRGGKLGNARDLYRPSLAIDELSTPEQFADFVAYLLTTQVISAQVMGLDSKMLF